MPSLLQYERIERLTRNFYEWELQGRGWRAFSHFVPLEPTFRRFPGHLSIETAFEDDGRRHTLFSSLIDRLSSKPAPVPAQMPEVPEPPEVSGDFELTEELEVLIPQGEKVEPGVVETWLRSASAASRPISFELIGMDRAVTLRLACAPEDLSLISGQLRALLPCVQLREPEYSTASLFGTRLAQNVGAIEFGLAREFMLPLRDMPRFPDALTALIGAVSQAGPKDLAILQILFVPVQQSWAPNAIEAVTSPDGKPFFLDAPELTSLAHEKFNTPLYAACVRVLANGETEEDTANLLRAMASALSQYGDPRRNALVPIACEDVEEVVRDILFRTTHRSGMLLSLSELCSLVRLPGDQVRSYALVRTPEHEVSLPSEVLGSGATIGRARHKKRTSDVRLSEEARIQHTYIIGGSGTGKSTLLLNLILQDIHNGHGVGVLDPHGDLVDEILARIPPKRTEDVVLLDPSDPDWVVGWNILGAHSDVEKELLASDLVAVFKRLSTSWGDQMSVVLGNAVLAFLESRQGGTLSDLRRFLLDDTFRKGFLGTVEDEHVVSFWKEEFPLLVGKKPQAPILTRLDTFLRSRLVRSVVTEREKPLNFREIIEGRQIFLAKLSQGAIGEENAALLGSLIVSKFHQVSLSRQDTKESERKPFFLFLDEFHQMVTPSMAGLFSGVRKYRLGLTVAHQDLYQLRAAAPEVERAALANAYTRIIFRVSHEDARKLERGLGGFSSDDLTNLARGEAIVRLGKGENAFRLTTGSLERISAQDADSRRAVVRLKSMERYGTPRLAVQRGDKRETLTNPATTLIERRPRPAEEAADRRDGTALEPPTQGRGGAMHKYLQSFIREAAQQYGFRVEIEKHLPDGKRIDVWIAQGEVSIGFEIAGVSTIEHELANLRKCLEASCSQACAVSLDAAFLRRIELAANESLPAEDLARLQFLAPEELLPFLASKTIPASTKRVSGYAVEVRHSGASGEDERKRAVAGVLLKSLRRMREKG